MPACQRRRPTRPWSGLTDANPGQQMTEQPELFEAFRHQMREYLQGTGPIGKSSWTLSDATPFFQRARGRRVRPFLPVRPGPTGG